MQKIQTAQIIEEINCSPVGWRMFPKEQKRCHRGTSETSEFLYLDNHILSESEASWKNVSIAYNNNKLTDDMVLQIWILVCLKIYKVTGKVRKFITEAMKKW